MDKVILTREGYHKLSEELEFLRTKKRLEVAHALETARAHGDLRENAEYDAAKQAKAQLEGRIAMLEDKLSRAKIVDTKDLQHDKAFLGATVKVKNMATQDTMAYTLVPQDEADFAQGKISVTSPIGQGLLGKNVGDLAEIKVPAGLIKLEVIEITYG